MKTFVVLGMHRSATSLAAKGLARSGIHMGDSLLGVAPSNPYGHWEDVDFVRLNDRLLKAAGGSWNHPPPEEQILSLKDEKGWDGEIERLVRRKRREPFWGWKDPRTVLTIRLYLSYLEGPHFIACFREPEEVAKSLARREREMTKGQCLSLAEIYNERLLRFLSEWTSIKSQL